MTDSRGRAGDAPLGPEVHAYYAGGREATRLFQGHGPLERVRTQDIIGRYLPAPPARVLDVGDGSGVHAGWLAARGYAVHLVDLLPLHVDQARRVAAAGGHPLAGATVADARRLPHPGGRHDAVLLLGPLYHLTERADRLLTLREARRVLRPGGVLFAAGISRFASLLAGLFDGLLADPDYRRIVEQDLADGQHRNPTPRDYFTTGFFHHPDELAAEAREAGFSPEAVLGVEGPGWPLADLPERWADPDRRAHVLLAARLVEREPSLLGLSAHVMLVARPAP